jgi:hypothetical protein
MLIESLFVWQSRRICRLDAKHLDLCSRLELIWKYEVPIYILQSLRSISQSLFSKICLPKSDFQCLFLIWGSRHLQSSVTGLLHRCGKLWVSSCLIRAKCFRLTSWSFNFLRVNFRWMHLLFSKPMSIASRFSLAHPSQILAYYRKARQTPLSLRHFQRDLPWCHFLTPMEKIQLNKSIDHSTPDETIFYFSQLLSLL